MGLFHALCFLCLVIGPVHPNEHNQSLAGGRTRKLVRRKKQPLHWDLEESRNIVYKPLTAEAGPESRAIRPVKIKRRKIVNGKPQRIIKKTLPQVSSVQDNLPKIIPAINNVTESVAPKPDEAKRFLSLFTIVSFKNDACTSLTGNNGTCFSARDCDSQGGVKSGTCASGFGVCCLFSATCGGVTAINGTYFQSSGYPSTYDSVGSCQLTVNKCAESVCQLRLDVENMILAQPESTDHKCDFDQFIVTGGSPIPAICGTNNGLHMYVDMGLSTNSPVVLTVVTAGNSFSRSFSVKVTQIECDSLAKAADGCLQYFTGVSGQMFSFNYNDASGLQLSDTDYSICVRMERNFCGIQYTACPDTINTTPQSFSISGTSNTGSQVGTGCSTDWLTIPCATNTNDPFAQNGTPVVCVDRICGQVFNSAQTSSGSPNVPVYSFSKPFHIYVHTDSLEGSSSPPESLNRGFCLNFVQQPCTASTG